MVLGSSLVNVLGSGRRGVLWASPDLSRPPGDPPALPPEMYVWANPLALPPEMYVWADPLALPPEMYVWGDPPALPLGMYVWGGPPALHRTPNLASMKSGPGELSR